MAMLLMQRTKLLVLVWYIVAAMDLHRLHLAVPVEGANGEACGASGPPGALCEGAGLPVG